MPSFNENYGNAQGPTWEEQQEARRKKRQDRAAEYTGRPGYYPPPTVQNNNPTFSNTQQDNMAAAAAAVRNGTDPFSAAIQQGGPNVAQYPNQRAATYGNQAMDPYQLPTKPTFANQPAMNPGNQQISTVGPYGQPNAGPQSQQQVGLGPDGRPVYGSVNPLWINGQVNPNWSGPNPGNQPRPQFGSRTGDFIGQGAGPRPQQPPTLAPGQQQYTGPAIVPMGRPPQSAFGQQNPTRFVPGFQPNAWQGFGRGTINPYQPPQQGQQWGY